MNFSIPARCELKKASGDDFWFRTRSLRLPVFSFGFIESGGWRPTLNGTSIGTGDANECTEFFAPLDAEVPVASILKENVIEVKTEGGATLTSVQLVTRRKVK